MAIRVLTFDLDHTLWDTDPVMARAEQAMYDWLAAHVQSFASLYTPQGLREYRINRMKSYPDQAWRVTAFRYQVLRALLRQCAVPEAQLEALAEQAFQAFYQERSRLELFPQAQTVLEELAAQYPLVAVTNGNADLDIIGVNHLFVRYLNAEIAGAPKPEQAMFLQALAVANATPEQAIHIGDSPEMDIVPAKALGMKTVWANFYNFDWPADLPRADVEINHIIDLPAAIAGLAQQ